MLRVNARDLVFWFFGLGTAIAVNLVSESRQSVKVILIAISVAAAIGAAALLSGVDPSSYLRHYAPHVLLTIATPLILLAAVGVWSDYTW